MDWKVCGFLNSINNMLVNSTNLWTLIPMLGISSNKLTMKDIPFVLEPDAHR